LSEQPNNTIKVRKIVYEVVVIALPPTSGLAAGLVFRVNFSLD
jgi:hypothetical protein